jgi:S-DNA-T family DNA segregation ATPase FtsK/SpoIIIE
VAIEATGSTPIGSVLQALARLTGLDVATVQIDDDAPDPLAPVTGGNLRNGSIVAVAQPQRCPGVVGHLDLRAVSGPSCGHSYPLHAGSTLLGRGVARGIGLADPHVSRQHLDVVTDAEGIWIVDRESANGTALDGAVVGQRRVPLRPGMRLRVGDSTLEVAAAGAPALAVFPTSDGHRSFDRPPRLDAPDPSEPRPAVTLPPAPLPANVGRLPLIATAVPLVMGLVLAAAMRRPEFLLFAALSPAMMLGQWISDRTGNRRRSRIEHATYLSLRAVALADIDALVEMERAERRRRAPDPAAVLAIALAPSARLWERRLVDSDFLQVTLGTGTGVAGVLVHEDQPPSGPLLLHDIPIVVSLREVGVLGLAGNLERVTSIARNLVGQLATLHRPGDLGIVLLSTSDRADGWDWMRWLPHLNPTRQEDCQALVGLDGDSATARIGELVRLIAVRRQSPRDDVAGQRSVVVLVDGSPALKSTAGIATVLAQGPAVGVFTIYLDADELLLPSDCGAVAVTSGPQGTRLRLRQKLTGQREDPPELIGDGVDIAWAERLSRALSPLSDDTLAGESGLPREIAWIDLVGAERDELTGELAARWSRHTGQPTGSTRISLGMGIDGPVYIDIAADGPHALVAGTTGSGKSELLQTLVAALACANRPDELNFILVDYKGGAAFGPCASLPHTVGVVTDLDGSLVQRALTSFAAELTRRESLLAPSSCTGIDQYRAAGGRLARLVIVVDEFATLAEELPDFVTGLVAVAQRGRSLGVHLVLATQRPEGVVSADIRANANLRICLGVTRDAESRDVIDTVDAARISRNNPGRGYLRTGHGELQVFQSGRVGGVSVPSNAADRVRVSASPFRALARPSLIPAPSVPDADSWAATDLERLVEECARAAERLQLDPPERPWLETLPAMVIADRTGSESANRHSLKAFFGVHDVPGSQSRQPMCFDLETQGHLLIAGSPRSGRTTAVRSLTGLLAEQTSAQDLHIYAIDAGGGLGSLAELPHCGAVVGGHEPDRARRLLAMLGAELSVRQALLTAGGFGSISELRSSRPIGPPHILLAIDGWESFVSAHEEVSGGATVESAHQLLRRGEAVGIHVVITAERSGLVGRLASSIENRLVLRLADRSDFSLIGLPIRSLPAELPAGRGIWVEGLLETQIFTLTGDPTGVGQSQAILEIAAESSRRDAGLPHHVRPRRVEVVPARISWIEIAAEAAFHHRSGAAVVILGVGGDELQPITVDLLDAGPGFVISGPPRSGRSTALATIAANLTVSGWRVVAITPRPSLLATFASAVLSPADPDFASRWDVETKAARAKFDGGAPLAVIVDDAELVVDAPASAWLDIFARTARDTGNLLVIGGTTEELAVGFRGFVVDARRSRSGILLAPRGPLDGELLGVRLMRTAGAQPPAGRGIAVTRGELTPLQVALPA